MAPECIAKDRPVSGVLTQLQAASRKRQAASCDNLSLDIMINKGYSYIRAARELVSIRSGISHAKRASREKQAAAPNKRRKHEKENNQTRIPSWWRKTGRSTCERRQIPTGTHPGDAAGTPRVPNIGSKIHRDRISRHSKSSRKRSSSRLCLELNQLAPSWGLATSHLLRAASSKRPSSKQQATSAENNCR